MAIAYYGSILSPNQIETAEGYLICRNVPIARTGQQMYTAREFGLDGDPDAPVTVTRRPEDVFEEAAIASFEGKPVTDGHPGEDVRAENYTAYARGHLQNVRRSDDTIMGDIYINDPGLASDVRNNIKREVSCGYRCTLVPDGAGGYFQTHIRGNHVAVVPLGRAGHDVAIHDAADMAEKGRTTKMSEFKKGLLAVFGKAAKDASDEELDTMVGITATALDADPAGEAQEAAPAADEKPVEDKVVYKEPKGDDIGSKLDRILEMLEAKSRGGRGEGRMHDESDIDELVDKLTGGEEAKLLEADDCRTMDTATRDAAVSLLRKVRPAVAAIADKAERARVTDALISAVSNDSVYGSIAAAAKDSAQKAAGTSQTSYEQACADAQAGYDERNPHRNKGAR